MSSITRIQQQKRAVIARYAQANNLSASIQILTTLLPLTALWFAAAYSAPFSYVLPVAISLFMSFFLLRVFVLMHDCGHGALFRSPSLNRGFGFLLGVLAGMPQYVWSQHHAFHHATNGDWSKYRGPLAILSTDEYALKNAAAQRQYCRNRSIWLAPIAGFFYLLLTPRLTWLKGSLSLVLQLVQKKTAQPSVPIRELLARCHTPYWTSHQEYAHMSANNLVLMCLWGLMCWLIGPLLFFSVYVLSVSIAGGLGIILFSVQHNFEHAYASDTARWDHDQAALTGTSFLVLPRWLNWFSANIAYHHIHHLCSRIPNYRLAQCHTEYSDLFKEVRRIPSSQIYASLQCILWDQNAQRIISVAEYQASQPAALV